MNSDEKKMPGGMNKEPKKDGANTERCSQCFYPAVPPKQPSNEECSQCFYEGPDEETKREQEETDCSQCFYRPEKP